VSIVCLGEVLWDVQNQTETIAGAPLNVAVALRRLGNTVALISAVGADESGQRALQRLRSLGIATDFVNISPKAGTGVARVDLDAFGNPSYAITRPAAFDFLTIHNHSNLELSSLQPSWLYFGTLAQTSPQNEQLLSSLIARFPGISCFYDLNLRNKQWDIALVKRLAQNATVLKLNKDEARVLHGEESHRPFLIEEFCSTWADRFQPSTICLTLGSHGCAIFTEGKMERYSGFATDVVDTVGAGDAFSAAFLHGLSRNWPIDQTARFANALGSIVAGRATAIPDWTLDDLVSLIK
jgi:fructokinase